MGIFLLEPDPLYGKILTVILKRYHFEFSVLNDEKELLEEIKQPGHKIILQSISILNTELAPTIMQELTGREDIFLVNMVDRQLEDVFNLVMNYRLRIVLAKPVNPNELVTVIRRLQRPDQNIWFGLENYIPNITTEQHWELNKSALIADTVNNLESLFSAWGMEFENLFEVTLAWQEVLSNAVYHSHGFTAQKEQRKPVILPPGKRVVVHAACNDDYAGISIRDFMGTLTPHRILESLSLAIEQRKILEESYETGLDVSEHILDRGRGLDIIRKLSHEYYFVLKKNYSTEVIFLYDRLYHKDGDISSIKIFELGDTFNSSTIK